MSLTKKVSLEELKGKTDLDLIEEKLQQDSKNAYTINGLLIELFDVKEKDIENKPFTKWPKGVPSKYTKTRLHLEKLVKKGLVAKKKHGKAGVYWWIGKNSV